MDEKLFETRLGDIEWLAEQMPGGFFIYKAEEPLELVYVNRAACRIFGCDSVEEFKELTGYTFRGMVHPEDFAKIQSSIDDQIQSSGNADQMDYVVYRIIRKDGTVRWVDDYGHFASMPGYGNIYYVFIGDITETRIIKEEKERNRALAESLRRVEHANRAKTIFLSDMSHEIRTPINAILGMNEMILRECRDNEIKEYAANIKKAGVSLLGIISDILDISKIEAGRIEFVRDKYSVVELICDMYSLIRLRAEEKGLDVDIELDPSLPGSLIGDELRIKQVLTNLLTNAVKYTNKGQITFHTELLSLEDGEARIRFTVADTGIGIEEDKIGQIFDAYERLDENHLHDIEGTGLGLPIVKQILDHVGSELEVESEYHVGSRFSFTLRQDVADETPVGVVDPCSRGEDDKKKAPRSTFKAKGRRILVVDDTPMNIEVVKGLLKHSEMTIDIAESGAECIEMVGKSDYDLIFLDYRMPKLDGIETLEELKKKYPGIETRLPIICLTASALAGEKEHMLSSGFTDYLTKPVIIEELEDMLTRYLGRDDDASGEEKEDDRPQMSDEAERLPEGLEQIAGINVQEGLEYCGDADNYLMALALYHKAYEDKKRQIKESLAVDDLGNYTIAVHSLKSSSRAIGCEEIFRQARALEIAGKNGDYDTIRRDTPMLLDAYGSLVDKLAAFVVK